MAWIILAAKEGPTDFDQYVQLVRHNGTTGEACSLPGLADLFPVGSNTITSFGAQAEKTRFIMAGNYGYLNGSLRYTFSAWPPVAEDVTFHSAGTPVCLSGYFLVGGVYYGLGGNTAGGTTPFASFSTDGLNYYSKSLLLGFNYFSNVAISKIRRGANGRILFLAGSNYYTDDFITFTPLPTGLGTTGFYFDAAGTSTGEWALCSVSAQSTLVDTKISTDNLATFSVLSGRLFNRVWAYGTTLYGVEGGRVFSSTDATTWSDKGLPFGSASIPIQKITSDGTSTFLIVGDLGNAVTTTDFTTYTALPGNLFLGHRILDADYAPSTVLYPATGSGTTATIQGTLRLDSATGAFAARKVYLYNYITGAKVAETTSDSVSGAWFFMGVASGTYFVVGVAQDTDLTVPRDFDAMGVITVV